MGQQTLQGKGFIFNKQIRTISGVSNTALENDELILCDTSLGPINIDLLTPQSGWDWGYKIYFLDSSGSASSNNITINSPVGVLINGQSSVILNNNNGSMMIRIVDENNYLATYGSIDGIINTTYSNFYSIITSGSLSAGSWYRISDFATSHYILEDPSHPSNIGGIEPLYVFATSNSTIDKRVVSENYSNDLIYWEYEPSLFYDDEAYYIVGSPGGLVSDFKGVITYRKDTDINFEAYYDFREFVFRRWNIDSTSINLWDSLTTYLKGTIVIDPANSDYYIATEDVSPTANSPRNNGNFVKILQYKSNYIFPQPYTHTFTFAAASTTVNIPINSSDYQDFLTIDTNFSYYNNILIEKRNKKLDLPYNFTGYFCDKTSVPNVVLYLTGLGDPLININGFKVLGESANCTFVISNSTTEKNHKGIEIKNSVGILFECLSNEDIENLEISIKSSDSNILAVDYIQNSEILYSNYSIYNGIIEESRFTRISSSYFREGISTNTISVENSYLDNILNSDMFCRIYNCKFMSLDTVRLGSIGFGNLVEGCDIFKMNSEDLTSATHVYDSHANKVMGTTGGTAWTIYIDNGGTLQTDLATN